MLLGNSMDSAVASPSTSLWNVDRLYLTGRFHQETKFASGVAKSKGFSMDLFGPGVEKPIGCYHAAIQELIFIDDLLSTLVGIEGRYISMRRVYGKDDIASFQFDAFMDLALQSVGRRKLPALYCARIALTGTNHLRFEVYKMVLAFMNRKKK